MQTADSRGRFWLGGILDSPQGGTLSFFYENWPLHEGDFKFELS